MSGFEDVTIRKFLAAAAVAFALAGEAGMARAESGERYVRGSAVGPVAGQTLFGEDSGRVPGLAERAGHRTTLR